MENKTIKIEYANEILTFINCDGEASFNINLRTSKTIEASHIYEWFGYETGYVYDLILPDIDDKDKNKEILKAIFDMLGDIKTKLNNFKNEDTSDYENITIENQDDEQK